MENKQEMLAEDGNSTAEVKEKINFLFGSEPSVIRLV